MKNIRLFLLLAFCVHLSSVGAQTAEDINFVPSVTESKEIKGENAKLLTQKIEQIIAVNNAGAISVSNAFAIDGNIVIGDTYTSTVGVRPVTLQRGQLNLIAKNRVDGSTYNTVSFDLEAAVAGGSKDATVALIKSIKPKDKAFVRFIRNSRTRIAEYYANNGMELPVYEEKKEEPVAQPQAEEENVDIDLTPLEFGKQQNQKAEPAVEATPQQVAPQQSQPAPQKTQAILEYNKDNWDIELIWCHGYTAQNSIRFEMKFTNKTSAKEVRTITLKNAYTPAGGTISHYDLIKTEDYSDARWDVQFPSTIPVGRVFELKPVTKQFDVIPLVEMTIGGMNVNIKDMPVEWQ